MKEEKIKELLKNDLKKITDDNFNVEIIQQLNTHKEEKTLFDSKNIFISFIAGFIFVVFYNFSLIKLPSTSVIITGIIFSISPIYFMIFNKIYNLSKSYQNQTENTYQ